MIVIKYEQLLKLMIDYQSFFQEKGYKKAICIGCIIFQGGRYFLQRSIYESHTISSGHYPVNDIIMYSKGKVRELN